MRSRTFHLRHPAIPAALLLALLLLSLLPVQPARAQDVPIVYEHFNTEMTLGEDGVLHVRLIQQIRFDGEFSGAYYAIPLQNITSIANVQLYGAATEAANYELNTVDLLPIAPNTVENNGREVIIDWSFPRTQPGDVRLFVIEFDAFGVIWVYPDQDFISWKAIGEDRSGITVNESEVQLTLPEIVPMEQITVTDSSSGGEISVTGQTITYVAGETIPDGTAYTVEAYFPHALLNAGVREWQRLYDGEALRVEIEGFHADLTINADGTLDVVEETQLTVLEGALHQGVRAIKLLYVDEITQPSVSINGQPLAEGNGDCTGCFLINAMPSPGNWVYLDPQSEELTIDQDLSGVYNIDWYTPLPLQAGEQLTTTIAYQAVGLLRVNSENQLLTWQVVPGFGEPVNQASLRLVLPPGLSPEEITMEGPLEQGTPQIQPDGSLLYRFDGPVAPGAWQIALTLPADTTDAEPPLWQVQFEEVLAQADAAAVTRARNTLIQRIVGILAIIGAILAAVLAWFRWGRRKVKETLGGYASEPPSQQSPAVVSYLVDRKSSERGILGSLFYLASLRLIEIDLEGEIKLRRLRDEPLQSTPRLTDAYGETVPIARHIQALFDQVLLPSLPLKEWVSLDSIANRLRDKLPEIYAALGSDLQKYYIRIPGSDSDTIPGTLWFFTYATLLGLMFFEIIPWFVGFILGFIALLVFVGWSAIQETSQGGYSDAAALEADRWRRFKTYLLEIKKYGDQAAAQEIVDRYFGYAVALGVEDVVLAQAADFGTVRPVWMPGGSARRSSGDSGRWPRISSQSRGFPWTRPTTPLPPQPSATPERPTLAGASAALGDSIRQASRSLGSILSTAAGDAGAVGRTVVVNSQLRRREMQWKPNTPVNTVLDDILRQSVADARELQAREVMRRQASQRAGSESSGWDWDGDSGGSSSSRSTSSFGRSSSSSSSFGGSSSSSRSSSSSTSRSSGGGRSGFR